MKKTVFFLINVLVCVLLSGICVNAEYYGDAEFDESTVIVAVKPRINQFITAFSFDESFSSDTAENMFGKLEVEGIRDLNPFVPKRTSGISLFSTDSLPEDKIYEVTLAETGRESVIDAVDYLNTLPNIKFAEPNYIVTMYDYPDDEWYLPSAKNGDGQYGLEKINAPDVWNFDIDCSETVVAIIDSGVQLDHEDLRDNLWINKGEYGENGELANNGIDDDGNDLIDDVYGWDFNDDGNGTQDNDVSDTNGHGTHVAGIVAAATNNGLGVASLARNVKIAPIKIFSSVKSAKSAYIYSALEYAKSKGFKIVNNSYGASSFSDNLAQMYKKNTDTLYVCAAGNGTKDIDNSPEYPASIESANILSVASTDQDDDLAVTSNWGVKSVDLAAPGVSILSTYIGGQYGNMGGTSMACPMVTGAAAVLKTVYPDMSPEELIEQITSSTDKVSSLANKVKTGGRLNAYNMLFRTTAFDKEKVALYDEGETATLTPQVIPQHISAEPVWTSDNESVVTVDNGVLTAISDGTATVTYSQGPVSGASCKVIVDTVDPVGEITYSTIEKTRENVTATLSVSEEIEEIEMTHTFTRNGIYTFKFQDLAGRKGTATAIVDWIDNTPPVGTITYSTENPTNQNVTATLSVNEEIKPTQITHTFTANGTYTFEFEDLLGNQGTAVAKVDWIDREPPVGTVTYSTENPTNQDVIATLSADEEIKPTQMTHTFTENDTYTFEFEDLAGNKGTAVAKVDWIDREPPVGTVTYSTESLTNQDVIAALSVDKAIKPTQMTHTFTENDTYTFEFEDLAGNTGTASAKVDWIDKTPPTASVAYTPNRKTYKQVIASITPSEEILDTETTHIFSKNDTYTFEFEDLAGNKGTATATVDWILTGEPQDFIYFSKSGNVVTAELEFEKTTPPPSEDDIILYVAYKDENGILKRVEEKHSLNYSAEFTIPDGFEDYDISVYVWGKDMIPIMDIQHYNK